MPRALVPIFIVLCACLLVPAAAVAKKAPPTGGVAYEAPAPTPTPAPPVATTPPAAATPPATTTPPATPAPGAPGVGTLPPDPILPEPGFWTGVTVPGTVAKILPDGTAAAPADAPPAVQQAIWAANWLQDKPYLYGGGHKDFVDDAYDCSGTVSFALHAAGLLDSPLDSGSFMRWGAAGKGAWITVYTNPGHAFAVIAGLRLDTSSAGVRITSKTAKAATERGPRWRPTLRDTKSFKKRHPLAY
jgi:cell wall-associated NlpC family hydrolase